MNLTVLPGRINLQKPTFEFYEEGEWMRIVVPGKQDRFLKKNLAIQILGQIHKLSKSAKSDLAL